VEEVVILEGECDAVADVLAEPRVDRDRVAPTDHQVESPVSDVLEHRVLLGKLDRVIRGDQRHGRAQDDPLRVRCDEREQGRRGGRHERRVVVLSEGEHVEADLVGATCDPDDVPDPLGLALRVTRHRVRGDVADGEDAELHDSSSRARPQYA
jgi:hypothetical protein